MMSLMRFLKLVLLASVVFAPSLALGSEEWKGQIQRQNPCKYMNSACVLSVNACVKDGSQGFGLYFDLFVTRKTAEGRVSIPAGPRATVEIWPRRALFTGRSGSILPAKEVLLSEVPIGLVRETVFSTLIHGGYESMVPMAKKLGPSAILKLSEKYTGAQEGAAFVHQVYLPVTPGEVGRMVGKKSLVRFILAATGEFSYFYVNLYLSPSALDSCPGLVSDY